VILDGLKPTLAGVLLGLALAATLVRVMTALLCGVSPHDPGTSLSVTGLVLAVGILATLIPAYRATRVDPIRTLRAE
jgi:putative ABC transport system permease protein